MKTYRYTIEHVNEKNREELLNKINRLGAHGFRVVQFLNFSEREAEHEDDDQAYCAGTILIEALVTR